MIVLIVGTYTIVCQFIKVALIFKITNGHLNCLSLIITGKKILESCIFKIGYDKRSLQGIRLRL